MPYSKDDFQYGPAYVIRGVHKGRIGEFDNDTYERGRLHAVMQFAPFGVASNEHLVPVSSLRQSNTKDLFLRYENLWNNLTPYKGNSLHDEERINALEEFAYVSGLLNNRIFEAQFMKSHKGAKIFLSHSSADKSFVKGLAVDLANQGHLPWLDEWEILGGESIPTRVAEGLEASDFVVIVLSENSTKSKWVENEWQTKYWQEIDERRVSLIPVLLSDCTIPTLLKTKKYIDFRDDYATSLESLSLSISKHLKKLAETK